MAKFTPGDMVHIHDQPKTVGIVIETWQEPVTLAFRDPPEVIKVDVARVMWAVDPPEVYTYRPGSWQTYEPVPGGTFLDVGYVYAPYVPLQVTPTLLTEEDFKTPKFSYYKRALKR